MFRGIDKGFRIDPGLLDQGHDLPIASSMAEQQNRCRARPDLRARARRQIRRTRRPIASNSGRTRASAAAGTGRHDPQLPRFSCATSGRPNTGGDIRAVAPAMRLGQAARRSMPTELMPTGTPFGQRIEQPARDHPIHRCVVGQHGDDRFHLAHCLGDPAGAARPRRIKCLKRFLAAVPDPRISRAGKLRPSEARSLIRSPGTQPSTSASCRRVSAFAGWVDKAAHHTVLSSMLEFAVPILEPAASAPASALQGPALRGE